MAVKRKINGISVEFSDQGADAVDGLTTALDDEKKKTEKAEIALKDQKAAFDKLQGEFDAEKKTRLTDADVEAKVTERLAVVDKARALKADLDPTGKTLVDIMKEAVVSVQDGMTFEGKSAEYVEAFFDSTYMKREKKGKQSAKKAGENAGAGNGEEVSIADAARDEFVKKGQDAWKHPVGAVIPGKAN